MERAIAVELMNLAMNVGDGLSRMDQPLREISDEREKNDYLRVLGEIMINLNSNIIRKIAGLYPDLDPDI